MALTERMSETLYGMCNNELILRRQRWAQIRMNTRIQERNEREEIESMGGLR